MDYINARLTNINSINDALEDIAKLKITKQDKLSDTLTSTVAVGGIAVGDSFAKGTSLEDILRALLGDEE